jgi:AraC family transcriptional regulator
MLKIVFYYMYFTSLPDHAAVGFDEQLHFNRFSRHNMIFNAESKGAGCEDHVGCLSIKTVISGEEWYGVDDRSIAVRPGHFLILNDDQRYSCRIPNESPARILSIFFRKEFARSVFLDLQTVEDASLDNPLDKGRRLPEFFQTLHPVSRLLQKQLQRLILHLEAKTGEDGITDEHLIFLLRHLIRVQNADLRSINRVDAIKAATRQEIYRRLCCAKDLLHSCYKEKLDLDTISAAACLSIPQLVRQFRSVFRMTPHKYLAAIRLRQAAGMLEQFADMPIHEITWRCGFENTSAFCRAFRMAHGIPPEQWRNSPRRTSSLPSPD